MERAALPVGCRLRRTGHQLRAVQRGGRTGRPDPRGRRRPGDTRTAARGRRLRLARLPARRRTRHALRLPGARPLAARARPPLQPGEAAARSVRPRRGRPDRQPRLPVRAFTGRPGPRRQRRALHAGSGHRPVLRLGRRPAAAHAVRGLGDLRGPCARADPGAPRGPGPAARHLRRTRPPRRHRAPDLARGDGGRADAGAPVRPGRGAPGPRTVQLLGLQHHRLLRPAQRVRRLRQPGPAGQRVQGDGEGAARGRPGGHPRRGLQPHGRGQRTRSHAVLPGHRQRLLLPSGGRRLGALLRHHGHRQQPADAAPLRAPADHGLAAVLGHRDARRRLPLRPRGHPGPAVPRGGPAVRVLRPDPAGPGDQPRQADRRTLGRGGGRLPGGQLPAAVVGVERPLPGRRTGLLARRARVAGRVRLPADRLLRPVPAQQAPAPRERQLRHRARRVHAAGPGVVQREAQRGQRRGQPGRGEPQPVLELRGGGRHRRSRRARIAGPPAAQPPRHAAAVAGHPHAVPRRRTRAQPAGQQQRLLPGQRDLLDRLAAHRRAARPRRLHPAPDRAARRAPGAAPAPLLPGRDRDERRAAAARPDVAAARRARDDRAGLAARGRALRRRLPQRRRDRRTGRVRTQADRRLLPAAAQRLLGAGRLPPARPHVRGTLDDPRRHGRPGGRPGRTGAQGGDAAAGGGPEPGAVDPSVAREGRVTHPDRPDRTDPAGPVRPVRFSAGAGTSP
ncbi:GH13_11 / GH13 / GH13_13 / GH13_10 / CBM 48 / GH13_37 / GH13_36 [Streptomyces misionensis JCM 4497]